MRIFELRLPALVILALTTSVAAQENLDYLRGQADAIVGRDEALARSDVGLVFKAADAFADAGQLADADYYYLAGLRIEAHDFEHHLRFAQVLSKEGKQAEAKLQAQIVVEGCEDAGLVARALAITGAPPAQIAPFEDLQVDAPTLILVPLGGADVLLAQEEQKRLHDALGIDVQVRSLPLTMRLPARKLPRDIAGSLRRTLLQMRAKDPAAFSEMLTAAGFPDDDLSDDSQVIKISAADFRIHHQEDKAARLEQMAAQGGEQWSAEDLLEDLKASIPTATSACIRVMGVTGKDIFMRNTNYVFAISSGQCAVVSYCRFAASFNGEIPSRARLARRLQCQCLASAGRVFGVPRSTDPMSPLCYVNDIEEIDAKSDILSNESRQNFAVAFAAIGN